MRTKNYNCFAEGECKSTQTIEIEVVTYPTVLLGYTTYDKKREGRALYTYFIYVDCRLLSLCEVNTLAQNDGFDSVDAFFRWFNKPFKGKIIHFTDSKY